MIGMLVAYNDEALLQGIVFCDLIRKPYNEDTVSQTPELLRSHLSSLLWTVRE